MNPKCTNEALEARLRELEGVYYELGPTGFPKELETEVETIRAELGRLRGAMKIWPAWRNAHTKQTAPR